MTLRKILQLNKEKAKMPVLRRCKKCGYPCYMVSIQIPLCCLHYSLDHFEKHSMELKIYQYNNTCNSCKHRRRPIAFKHYYNKLYTSEFTTIRRKYWTKRYAIGDIIPYNIKGQRKGYAMLYKVLQKKISNIPLVILKREAEYENNKINSVYDFVKELNTIYKITSETDNQFTPNMDVAILFLRKIKVI